MLWTEIEIKAAAETEEILTGILYGLGATGLSIEDPRDIDRLERTEYDWDFVEDGVVNNDIEGIIVKVYFEEDEDVIKKIDEIKREIEENPLLDSSKHSVSINTVDENDWAENWKDHFTSMRVGENIVIKPSWEKPELKEDDMVIELDPGMAFGTGTHETTFMCAESLDKYQKQGDIVYDIGCGSGILSIVSAKLGAKSVLGVDLDPLAVKVSKENIISNKVDDIVDIKEGDLLEVVNGRANIIVANIVAEIVATMVPDLKPYLEDDGIFITSGIIQEKVDLVKDSLVGSGFNIIEVKNKNDWACIIASLK